MMVPARDAVLATLDHDLSLVSVSQHSPGKGLRSSEHNSTRLRESTRHKIHSQLRRRMKADLLEVILLLQAPVSVE